MIIIAIIIILLFVTLSCETKEITVEKIVEVEVIREVPVEVFVEVPVEIEKIVEVFVEVPVEIEVVKEVVKVKEVFVTATPTPTPIPLVDKIDNEAFYECVANNTSQEVATGVSIDSDGFLNATETTEHEWDLILSCAIT